MRALALLLLCTSSPALARSIDVDLYGAGDYDTIQDAIEAAADGDEVVVGPGTYEEAVDFLGKAITVRSTGGSSVTTIDAGGTAAYAVNFDEDEDENAVLEGFTILNGTEQGVFIEGSPVLTDVAMEGMGGTSDNGGCVTVMGGYPTFEQVSFTDCVAFRGASLYVDNAEVTLEDATFTGGYGAVSGGLWIGTGAATITGGTFEDNISAGNGGAVYLRTSATLTLTDVDFTGNATEAGSGGAIYANDSNVVTISGGSFTGNAPESYEDGYHGGAITLNYGTLTVSGTTFDSNFGYYGGAIYTVGADVSFDTVTMSSNYAYYGGAAFIYGSGLLADTTSVYDANTSYYYGGALYVYYDVDATFTGTEFVENVAYYGYGGAVYHYYYGSALYDGVNMEENSAYYYGGGIYAYYLTEGMTVRSSTVSENEAQYGYGGGVYAYVTPLIVEVSDFSWNEAYYSGGGVYSYYGAELALYDSVFDHNAASYYSGGGAYFYPYTSGYDLNVVGCTFSDNSSRYEGGGLYSYTSYNTMIAGSRFEGNTLEDASYGGGLYLREATTLSLDNVDFVQNEAELGGGAYIEELAEGIGTVTVENNVFQENQATRYGGGLLAVDVPVLSFVNNTVVGNLASEAGGALYVYNTPLDFRNNIVAWTIDGASLYVDGEDAAASTTISYNDFYENAAGNAGGAFDDSDLGARANLEVDPELPGYSLDGDPDSDTFALSGTSPCIDAGDPAMTDADGSRADIGATGGDNAILTDADADGISSDRDCDDEDATVYPGATDTWYDGVNSDCGMGSDYDADGDGVDASSYGGEDCDDADASVWDDCGQTDTADTAVDTGSPVDSGPAAQDTSGGGGEQPKTSSCGCASAQPRGAAAAMAALALLAVRRRRER